jgi:dihydroorotate dehydrogenase
MEAQFLQQYGWAGIAVYFLFRDVWPWLKKRLDKSQDSDANIAEAKLTREAAREERMVRAMEDMAKTSRAIECILSSVNVRLDVIERRLGLDAATK